MITASHNPSEYNGLKFVGKGARPINADTGLADLARWVDKHPHAGSGTIQGKEKSISLRNEYVRDVLRFIDKDIILPMNVVANSGNGCASPVFDALAAYLPITVTRLAHAPDGSFPNGVPNPLLPENRAITARAVVTTGANIGIAWDGDFDRCFLFDSSGEFVEGYYLVGLLAATMLELHPGSTVIHDPRLVWNTQEIIEMHGGKPVESRCGHAFIKQAMRDVDAVYGGEMSGHHYFRDLFYCDSGMIPWLLVLEIMSRTGAQLSDLIKHMASRFPVSGEINRAVNDPTTVLENVESHYSRSPASVSHVDGLSMEFNDWRFNLRPSNTEPLLRLNVETRGDRELLSKATNELLKLISGQAA